MARPSLQQELGKRLPFESTEQEAYLNLLRTSDHIQHAFNRLFEAHGLSSPEYNVLRILRGAGDRGMHCQEIAARMITRMPDITRLVDRLERAGWVRRQRTDQDRRLVLVQATASGLDLLNRLDQPVMELHRQLLGHLNSVELFELNRLLVKIRHPQ